MKRVILESPYAGNINLHVDYARACMADCLKRGEAPYASHLLYTQPGVLNDDKPKERNLGIAAGLAWGAQSEATVVYGDLGISPGMLLGIEAARKEGRKVEVRSLPPDVLEGVLKYVPQPHGVRIRRSDDEAPRHPQNLRLFYGEVGGASATWIVAESMGQALKVWLDYYEDQVGYMEDARSDLDPLLDSLCEIAPLQAAATSHGTWAEGKGEIHTMLHTWMSWSAPGLIQVAVKKGHQEEPQ